MKSQSPSSSSSPSQSAKDLKNKMDKMLEHYLATNPVVQNNSQINELEVRFGTNPRKGKFISKVDYDNVIKKLLSCGFMCDNMAGITMLRISSEYVDKDTGVTKMSNIRAEIMGSELVQQYCRTNSIKKLMDMPSGHEKKMKFTQKNSAFIKDGMRQVPIQKVVFEDFNFNVSFNVERDFAVNSKHVADMVRNWTETRKTFRLINRVKFYKPAQGQGSRGPIIVDLSIIRNSNMSGHTMVPTHTMEESGIFTNTEHCEIELEVDNSLVGVGTEYTVENVKPLSDELRRVIRVVLSGLQGTNYPISYPEQDQVLYAYMRLVHGDTYESRRIVPRDFIGPSSCTLQLKNVIEPDANSLDPNIRNNYCVTDKADGDRKLMYIGWQDGKVYLINTNMLVEFTGCVATDKTVWDTIVDGEHIKYNVRKEFINTFAAFDLYHLAGNSVRELDFAPSDDVVGNNLLDPAKEEKDKKKQYRLQLLHKTIGSIKLKSVIPNTEILDFKATVKKFYPASNGKTIFDACNTVLIDVNDHIYPYETDGLIFTPMNTGVGGNRSGHTSKLEKFTWPMSFKWKPPKFNTIDFLVTFKKDKAGKDAIHTVFESGMTNSMTHYRTLELRCGFDKNVHAYINPFQDLIDDKIPVPKDLDNEDRYIPVKFQPTYPHDPDAYNANINLITDGENMYMVTEQGERFEENMIVEFSYYPDLERGWRWKPLKVRHDKTYNLRAGNKEYGNAYHVANDNWKSIHHPVTEDMLTTGQNIPNADTTDDVYYNKSKNEQVSYTKAMRNFHNLYVKRKLITGVSKRGDTLMDYAVGKAGDLSKWKFANLKFVFGVDVSKDNIYNQNDGACARYLNERRDNARMFDAIFLPGNSSVNIRNGDAFFSDKEHAIADAVFGKGSKDATKQPAAVYRNHGIGEKGFNVSSCQFALHYFFENSATFNNFLRNISECTQPGGHFIATCYDGKTVFNMLKSKKRDEGVSIYVEEKTKIFEIQKMYDYTGFAEDETSLGYAINVFQETINQYAVEYLVNFDFFRRSMENYGFVLATDEEARNYGFEHGSGMFDELFRAMKREVNDRPQTRKWYENALNMTEEEKRISYLNRYFIFKKAHNVNTEKVTKIVAKEVYEEEKKIMEKAKEVEEKLESKEKEKKPKAKKIKNVGKIKIDEYVPISEEAEDEDKSEDKEKIKIVVAEEAESSAKANLADMEKDIKVDEEVKVSDDPEIKITEEKAKKERCKDGTKRYKPLGEGCYTNAEIEAHKQNKTKKIQKKNE
jgi:hypothetical protein